MKSLNTFLNTFMDGFQFNNRFACKVIVPRSLALNETEQIARDWLGRGFVCESTNLPDRAFTVTQMTQYGITEQFPFHTEFTSLDCVFNTPLVQMGPEETDNPIPRVFHAWQNLIQDLSSTYEESSRDFTFAGSSSVDGYYGEIQLGVFDRQNNLTLAYEFQRVYPRVVQATPVTWKEENELAKLSIGFTFSIWRPIQASKIQGDWFPEPEQMFKGSNPFQNIQFTPPRSTLGGIVTGVISDIINDATNGRVRIG